ncbi:hypothetical protein [Paraburkholderia sp. J8-2]|uniref:hypothetical protein n=1 Tax=Paraburkholderia sp. J8-2 TaxID=2805440 RepID=UPI002AB60EF3|nr:hypothetical protein [Paraburkholderia sp. J8-2]
MTREKILAARDRASEQVDVPEWGGPVRVSVMSGAQREKLMKSLKTEHTPNEFAAHMVAATVVDEAGVPIFTDDDLGVIANKSEEVLARIVGVAMRLNGFGASAVEEAAKN